MGTLALLVCLLGGTLYKQAPMRTDSGSGATREKATICDEVDKLIDANVIELGKTTRKG